MVLQRSMATARLSIAAVKVSRSCRSCNVPDSTTGSYSEGHSNASQLGIASGPGNSPFQGRGGTPGGTRTLTTTETHTRALVNLPRDTGSPGRSGRSAHRPNRSWREKLRLCECRARASLLPSPRQCPPAQSTAVAGQGRWSLRIWVDQPGRNASDIGEHSPMVVPPSTVRREDASNDVCHRSPAWVPRKLIRTVTPPNHTAGFSFGSQSRLRSNRGEESHAHEVMSRGRSRPDVSHESAPLRNGVVFRGR